MAGRKLMAVGFGLTLACVRIPSIFSLLGGVLFLLRKPPAAADA